MNNEAGSMSGDVAADAPVDPKSAGGFDLSEDDIAELIAFDERRPSRMRRAAYNAWQDKHRADIEHNQRAGHIKQGLDAIDAHRKTPEGKADYNANRKKKRLKDAEAAGRTIIPRKRHETKAESAHAHADAKLAYKERKKAELALTSPDTQQAIRDEQARKKREQRKRKKKAAAKALADRAIFQS